MIKVGSVPEKITAEITKPKNRVGRPKGFKNPNAGRLARDNVRTKAREQVVYEIFKQRNKITLAMIEAAKGLYYTDEAGKVIYHKKPDTSIGEYLINQLIGKPKESVEVLNATVLKVDL